MNSTNLEPFEVDVAASAATPCMKSPSTESGPIRVPEKAARAFMDGDKVVVLEKLLTFAEAARLLGISLRQFRRVVDGGKITFVKVSKRSPRIRPSDLRRYISASAVTYNEVHS